jgi:hypothetical protein
VNDATGSEQDSMTDFQLSGLRLWIGSLIHWPAKQLHARIEATEHRFEEIERALQADIERRVWRFERIAVAWAIATLLLAIAGIFLLIGLWLGLAQLFGRVAASFMLAAAFGVLALIPLLVLPKVLRARHD